ncbi:hypothetical protein D3C72_1505210 [compost metagenome]
MKTVLSFVVTTLFTNMAMAQTAAEVTCRAQAKEVAVQTYSSCITQARNQQVEQIRADYQKELTALKAKYDKELKGISSKKENKDAVTGAALAAPAAAAPKKTAKASKAAKSAVAAAPIAAPAPLPAKTESPAAVAKQLPEKAVATEALPIQTVQEGTKVVAVGTEETSAPQEEVTSPSSDEVEISALPQE